MIAYRAETALASIVREKLARTDDARSLLRDLFCSEADLVPDLQQGVLRVHVHPMSNPRSNRESLICWNISTRPSSPIPSPICDSSTRSPVSPKRPTWPHIKIRQIRRSEGGPDIPAIHDGCSDFARSRGCRHIAGSTTPRAGGVGTARFTSLAPLRRRAARGFSVHRIRPWPQRRFLRGWSTVFLKPPISCSSRKDGLSDGYGPCSTTSGPRLLMSRCPSSTGAQHGA